MADCGDFPIPDGPAFVFVDFCDGTSFRNASPYAIRDGLVEFLLGPVEEAKAIKSGSLLVKTTSFYQTNRLLGIQQLMGKEAVAKLATRLNMASGTVFAPDLLDETTDTILMESRGQGVCKVSRFPNRKGRPNALLKVTFWGTELPSHLKAGYSRFKITPWVGKPQRCTRCQRFGHMQRVCRARKARCCTCAEEHREEGCSGPYFCANCGGPHPADSPNCPKWLKCVEEAKARAPKIRSADTWPSLPQPTQTRPWPKVTRHHPPGPSETAHPRTRSQAPLQRYEPAEEHSMNSSLRSEAAPAQPPTPSGPISSTPLASHPISNPQTPTPETSVQSEQPSNTQPDGDAQSTVAPPGAPTKDSQEDMPLTNPTDTTDTTEGTDSNEESASVNETIISDSIPKSDDLREESAPSPPRTRRRTLRKTKWAPTPFVKRSFVEDLTVTES